MDIPYGTDECVVMYGSIKFIRTKNKGYVPGPFGFKEDTNASHYMSKLPTEWFFNEDAVWLPLGSILKKKQMLSDIFGKHLFIRPDNVFKYFASSGLYNCDLDAIVQEVSKAALQEWE